MNINIKILLLSSIACLGCSNKFKRKEGVLKLKITEERQLKGEVSKSLLFYQEFDKNDSLIYSESYGNDNKGLDKPISIINKYFENGKLVAKITEYANENFKENYFYEGTNKIMPKNNGDSVIYLYNSKNELVKEMIRKDGKIILEKQYDYKKSKLLPEIIAHKNGKLWFAIQVECRMDTCFSFYKDSLMKINGFKASVIKHGRLQKELYNEHPFFNKQINNLDEMRTSDLNCETIYKYNTTSHLKEIEYFHYGNLSYKIIYTWYK